SKTIEEGNTSQQAREHHFQENLGRPHIFIYNYILVQYLLTILKIQLADGGMIKMIKVLYRWRSSRPRGNNRY
uniref:Uncharacterized protein n=1 Tax=Onchocerca volvulus TaxID=6282 RepID=A0A8R1XS40_ONCVO